MFAALTVGVLGHFVELVVGGEQDAVLARAHAVRSRYGRPGLNLDVLAGVAQRDPVLGTEAR